MKRCTRCLRDLPAEAYVLNATNKGGLRSRCRACEADTRPSRPRATRRGQATPRLRATRCPDCQKITMAHREGIRCGECRAARDAELCRINLVRCRVAYRSKHGIAISDEEAALLESRRAEARSIREEAVARGVPKYVIRAERARKAAGGREVVSATHARANKETPATAQARPSGVESEREPRSIGR
jgi:hypothetical protein